MDAVEFETLLNDVDTKLDRLKVLYEQWFQGMERLEPTIARKELERRVALLRKEQPRNTALRFRFQQFVMRYTTLQTYWGRIARQIEEGTYRRDLLKARNAMLASRGSRKRTTAEHAFDIEVEVDAIEDGLGFGADPLTSSTIPKAPLVPVEVTLPPAQRPVMSPIAPPPATPVGPPAAPRLVSPFARSATRAPGAPTQLPPAPPLAVPGVPAGLIRAARACQPAQALRRRRPRAARSRAARSRARVVATVSRPSTAPRHRARTAGRRRRDTACAASAHSLRRRPLHRPAAPPPAPAAPPRAESLNDQELRRVYDRYAEARRKNNEPSVSFDAVAKNLRDVAPKMREKYGKPVDFEVVLKDGKVGLKPVPKG